ncbi:MAG: hypothetical protein KGL39_06255 [Patescibacteria group bacterium]|nr:hypothetical protein [Patescibacteria group bacterium]
MPDDLTFHFEIKNSEGEVIASDWCNVGRIDEYGGSEMVDMHVASALRAVRREQMRGRRGIEGDHEMSHGPDCVYYATFDPGTDEWVAIKVYRDGNPIEIARFATQELAEECAAIERQQDEQANGQFGVGA